MLTEIAFAFALVAVCVVIHSTGLVILFDWLSARREVIERRTAERDGEAFQDAGLPGEREHEGTPFHLRVLPPPSMGRGPARANAQPAQWLSLKRAEVEATERYIHAKTKFSSSMYP